MRKTKSQTVRLKEEILDALANFVQHKGVTQQHIVSVGAWFFMCMPANLRESLTQGFYEWCKAPHGYGYGEPTVPKGAPDFAKRVIAAIEEECSKEASKFAMSDEDRQAWLEAEAEDEGPLTEDELADLYRAQAAEEHTEDTHPEATKKKATSPSKRSRNKNKGGKSG